MHVLDGLLDPTGEHHLRPTVYDLLADIGRWPCSPTRRPDWRNRRRFQLDQEKDFALFESFAHPRQQHPGLRLPGCSRPCACTAIWPGSTCPTPGPDALVDVELQRLAFVREHRCAAGQGQPLPDALTTLRTRLPKDSCWSEVTHAMARFHAGEGGRYQRLAGDAYKHAKDTALALCGGHRAFPRLVRRQAL